MYREAREVEEQKAIRAQRPKIQTQFADLKRALSVVTDEQWESIPEVGNLTKKRKIRDLGRTYAVPDSVIVGDRDRGGLENSLDVRQQEVSLLIENLALSLDDLNWLVWRLRNACRCRGFDQSSRNGTGP